MPKTITINNSNSSNNILNNKPSTDGVNLLRLSMNVKNNQWRDKRKEDEAYSSNTSNNRGGRKDDTDGDFLLLNRNEIVDIGGANLQAATEREDYGEFIY
jgi:hypothetical protein